MFDRFVELGELGGGHADTENNFVTVTDDNTIDMSHVSLSESCFQKQKQVNYPAYIPLQGLLIHGVAGDAQPSPDQRTLPLPLHHRVQPHLRRHPLHHVETRRAGAREPQAGPTEGPALHQVMSDI